MTDSPSFSSSDRKSILLIDGHYRDRMYYAEHLKASCPEYAVFQSGNGQGGLDFCKSHSIDCVVLDLDLPDMSGFEFLAKMVSLSNHPDMAVIILTRCDNQSLLDLALKNGAQVSLRKSLTSGELLSKAIFSVVKGRVKSQPVSA